MIDLPCRVATLTNAWSFPSPAWSTWKWGGERRAWARPRRRTADLPD